MSNQNTNTNKNEEAVPGPGKTLIASPFLKDPHFARSVIFLCDHSEEGSFGFMINKLFLQPLNELLPDTFNKTIKVYVGGPVQLDTIHFIHQYPDLIEGGLLIKGGICLGGNFEQMTALMNNGDIDEKRIKFFIGYSGWSAGQLIDEQKEDSWIVSRSRKRLLFSGKEERIWEKYLKSMGQEYAMMINYPIDPSLN